MEATGSVEKAAASQMTDKPMNASQVFQDWLVDNSGVQLNAGRSYGKGADRCMRMNIGCSRQVLKTALDSMTGAIKKVV